MRTNTLICCLAIAAFCTAGCAAMQQVQPVAAEQKKAEVQAQEPMKEEAPDPAKLRLTAAADLLAKGDFEGSLKEDQKALALAGKESPGDVALYNMGLIYVHYKNPNKNYEKARAVFERIVKEYPDSPLVEEAKIWAGVLQVIEKLKQVDIDIEEKKKELSR